MLPKIKVFTSNCTSGTWFHFFTARLSASTLYIRVASTSYMEVLVAYNICDAAETVRSLEEDLQKMKNEMFIHKRADRDALIKTINTQSNSTEKIESSFNRMKRSYYRKSPMNPTLDFQYKNAISEEDLNENQSLYNDDNEAGNNNDEDKSSNKNGSHFNDDSSSSSESDSSSSSSNNNQENEEKETCLIGDTKYTIISVKSNTDYYFYVHTAHKTTFSVSVKTNKEGFYCCFSYHHYFNTFYAIKMLFSCVIFFANNLSF